MEVESLLAANEAAGDFILTSAMSVEAQSIAHEEDAALLAGRVGAYDIVSLIGRGGMGEVYQAHDTRLGRKVALKLLRPALTGNAEAVRRFEQEARAASSLNHPNIVTIYEIGDMDGRRFLAMELVEGHSLSALVRRPVGTRRGRAYGRATREGAFRRARRRHRPSRHQAREHHGACRWLREAPRLRSGAPRPAAGRDAAARRRGHAGAHDSRHATLHVARAGPRRNRHGRQRRVLARRGALRARRGRSPVRGGNNRAPPVRSQPQAAPIPRPRIPDMPALERLLLRMLETHEAARPSVSDVAAELTKLAVAASHPVELGALTARGEPRDHNLPPQRTPLIGRAAEIADVKGRLLDPAVRLLTLTGPGGTGKTRLAIQVAADLAPCFEGGVPFVDLAPITEPNLVASTVARALGVSASSERPLVSILCEHLNARGPTLLLMDNFEQVSAAAAIVRELLDASPGLTVLVTSRHALRIYGEQEAPGLATAASGAQRRALTGGIDRVCVVALFVQRAAAVRPDFTLTARNAQAVVDICRQLDGLPLAIELAAARVKILPPHELQARLERRLDVLTGGARDLPERQQTLRRTITWSFDLLTPAEQKLFRRLSVFAGGCTLEAVEAVCNTREDLGVDVLEGVASLVDNSLLVRPVSDDSVPRFFMLETFREYARERLQQSGDADEAARAHAAYMLVLAEEVPLTLNPPEREPWLRTCDAEQDNIHAAFHFLIGSRNVEWALRLAAALFRFWEQREQATEGRETLARVLAMSGAEQLTPLRARALYGASVLADVQGDLTTAEAYSREACEIYRRFGDTKGVATTMAAMAWQAQHGGRYAEATRLHAETMPLWQELGDPTALDLARYNMANAARAQGDVALARSTFDDLLTSSEARHDLRPSRAR